MIPFANKGKQLILLPEDYVKTHYIGKLYGKHFEQSNGCPTMNRHWRFASNFGTTLLMMFRSFLHLNEYIR